nr:gustatory receptor 3 [Pachyrhinus yasumatsui]
MNTIKETWHHGAVAAGQVLNQKIMLSEANYKIIQPVVCTSRIFAVCPIIFTKVGSYYQLKYSPYLVLYSYLFVVVFGIGTILGVKTDIGQGENSIRMKNMKNRFISVCDISIVFMIALYSIIFTPYKMKTFVKMLDIWGQVDNLISLSNHSKYRKSSILFLSVAISVTTLLFLFDIFIYCYQWRVSNDPTFYIQVYISYYMMYFILVFQEIFFFHSVFFIHIRLLSLNENLAREKVKINGGVKQLFVIPYTTKNVGSGTENSEENKARISGRNSLCNDAKFGNHTANRIQEFLKTYGKIRESVEILNGSASYGIVMIMLSCLLHLVVTPYFLLVEIFKRNSSMIFMLLQGVWLLAHIGRLLVIVEPCQRCINEYKLTTNLVSELALLDFDEDTKKTLKDFASTFSYADINFHACGFFNINRNLLTSVRTF